VTDIKGGSVTTGIYETIGVDDVMFWVVDEGMVEIAGAIEVADVAVKVGVGPSCNTTGDKTSEVTVVGGGAETEAIIRDGDKDTGMS
ncbi:hypothetical protein KI387_019446, partial [Taxus chinensis]